MCQHVLFVIADSSQHGMVVSTIVFSLQLWYMVVSIFAGLACVLVADSSQYRH